MTAEVLNQAFAIVAEETAKASVKRGTPPPSAASQQAYQ